MRYVFGNWIAEAAEKDDKIILLVGDIGFGVFDKFKAKFPNRFINVGICEQTMVGMAAGMALEGLKPYVYTITPFLLERAFEQIKIDVCANNANVKLVGYADYPNQGITHRCCDGGAVLSALVDEFDNFTIYDPVSIKIDINKVFDMHLGDTEPAFFNLRKLK
jgi:transketolase